MAFLTPEALADRLKALRPALLAYAARIRPCSLDDAEDLVSEAVRLALKVLGCYNPDRTPLPTWLTGILKVVILMDRRDAQQEPSFVPLTEALSVPSWPALPLREAIQPHVDALPAKLGEVVSDHLDGFSQKEIAHRRGCHINTVANRLERAEKLLQVAFPDFERAYDARFFTSCGRHTRYKKPRGIWPAWRHRHPADKVWRFFYFHKSDGAKSALQMRSSPQRTRLHDALEKPANPSAPRSPRSDRRKAA